MKKLHFSQILTIVLCTVFTLPSANAQILKKLKQKAEQTVERKLEQKTEKETEKAMDSILNPDETYSLKFTAPSKPGEYPYICTFPGHWRIMQGVMIVK